MQRRRNASLMLFQTPCDINLVSLPSFGSSVDFDSLSYMLYIVMITYKANNFAEPLADSRELTEVKGKFAIAHHANRTCKKAA